jgi:Flp pilus assembly protein TadG
MASGHQPGILVTLNRFAHDRRGVSAIEFAMILPLMLTLYLGGVEITQAVTIKRKTTLVTRTIGDLVAQDVNITNAEMQSIFAATTAIAAPYPTNKLKITVSSVSIDGQGVAKIAWSDAYQATPRAVNSTVTLPTGLNLPNTTLIWAEAQFDYTPPIGYMITGTRSLKDKLYLRPRLVNTISRSP